MSCINVLKKQKQTMIRFYLLIISLIVLFPVASFGQGMSIDRFCEIYADSAPQRIDKIIRIFQLVNRPAEQLTGNASCQSGETFILKTTCIGPHRVAILSISNPNSTEYPHSASRLFHLKTKTAGDVYLTPCQIAPAE